MKTTCEVISFYYICKLYTWNLWKAILSQAFLKGFAKIACDVISEKKKKQQNLYWFFKFITWTKLKLLSPIYIYQ